MSIGVTSRLVPTAVTVPVLPIPPARESTPASTIISFRRRSAGSIGAPAVHGRENSPLDDGAVPRGVEYLTQVFVEGRLVGRLDLVAGDAQDEQDPVEKRVIQRGVGDLAQEGIPILSEDGKKFVFNTPQAVALLDKYRKAYSDGLMPRDVLSSKYLGNSELFNQQKVGWTTGGGNTIPSIAESNPTLAKQVVPSKAFGTGPLYVQGLSVSSKSKNLPAAIALARWVTNPQNQAQFAKEVPGVFPSTTASSKDPFFSKSDGTPAGDAKVMAFNTLKTAKLLQPVVVDSAMATFIDQQFALAISGKVSSKKALDDAVKKCNELLNNGQGS